MGPADAVRVRCPVAIAIRHNHRQFFPAWHFPKNPYLCATINVTLMNVPPSEGSDHCQCERDSNPLADPHLRSAQRGKLPTILVPTEFTPECDYALELAVLLAERSSASLTVLHIPEPGEDTAGAQQQLSHFTHEVPNDLPLRVLTVPGEVAETIARVAVDESAEFIVLGSEQVGDPEGQKQSETLRIFRYGTVPFIVVQRPLPRKKLEDIVLPIDYTDAKGGDTSWIPALCRSYAPMFHLVLPSVNEPELLERLELNLERTLGLLEKLGARWVRYDVPGRDEFSIEVLSYCQEVEADMVVVSSTPDPRRPDRYMLEPHERHLIQEAGDVPVLIVNPSQTAQPCES